MNFGEKIKALRENLNISQRAFGESLGKDQRSVSNWEVGSARPPFEVLQQICKIYNIDISYFTGESTVVEKPVEKEDDPVRDLLNKLVEQKIITDPDNIPESVVKIIMDAVRMDLRMQQIKNTKL